MDTSPASTGQRPCASIPLSTAEAAELAQQIQGHVHRLESLVHAIDDAIDFSASDSSEKIIEGLGRAIDFIHLHQEISPTVRHIAEEIEKAAVRAKVGNASEVVA